MTPYYSDPWLTVYQGDCREVMATMEPESVHCVVTSPPYHGLRDYGQPGQIGLEATPQEWVDVMVDVMRGVRRVMRHDATCWLNVGDAFADKQLVGLPWRLAFALQADGWYLRSDIIWSKPNPMPESVTDRPTKAHEYLFLLSKSPRYYYDADAVREPAEYGRREQPAGTWDRLGTAAKDAVRVAGSTSGGDPSAGRNLRSVWSIATQPYPGAHFATFPEALVEPCVKAGTSERGVCPECGAPWIRTIDRQPRPEAVPAARATPRNDGNRWRTADGGVAPRGGYNDVTSGWQPSCGITGSCQRQELPEWAPAPPVPATVLDPFAGSGTTGRVAQRLGRRAVLIDLSGEYLTQAMRRNQDIPLGLESA